MVRSKQAKFFYQQLEEKVIISDVIAFLEKQIKNPTLGLPEEVFLFITRMTPMVNVDLLIKDEEGRTLLSWRDDYSGTGWHIPGGIIRYKEKIKTRIQKVIETEIGLPVKYDPTPIAVNQLMCEHKVRGNHFISFLIKCFLSKKYIFKNKGLKENDKGFLKWYNSCPVNLIKVHGIYRKYIVQKTEKDY